MDSFDFADADQVPTARFNRVLWTGLMGTKPYPAIKNRVASQPLHDLAADD